MRHFVIYCHTCTPTGLKYVGQTRGRRPGTSPENAIKARWHHGRGYIKHHRFFAVIQAYGEAAFTHDVLEVVDNQVTANEAERRWIKQLGTQWPNGYNRVPGGDKSDVPPETREKMSQSQRMRWAKVPVEDRQAHARMMREEAAKAQTPEQKRASALKASAASAARPAEERRAGARKRDANLTPEQRAIRINNGLKVSAARSMEEKQRIGSKARAAWVAKATPEDWKEASRRAQITLGPEGLRARVLKGWETRRANQKKKESS